MNIGYQTSKNRVGVPSAVTEEQAFRLRRMAAEDKVKVSPFIGRLIDDEWERRRDGVVATEPESEAA